MINLMYGGNDYAFSGIALSLISIAKHCSEELNVFVLTMDLHELKPNYTAITKDEIEVLENYIKKSNDKSRIHLVDATEIYKRSLYGKPNEDIIYTPYTMLRLLADEIEEIPDKILYLDIDVLACGDITELYNYDVLQVEYGAVRDYYGKVFINRNYINAGVMLFNMDMIKQTKLFEKCRLLLASKKMMLADQDALNKCVQKRIYLPKRFNSQRRDHDDDVLRHFCKSIRWFPDFHKKGSKYKSCSAPIFKYFPLFHLLNVKPWDKEAVHSVLKCHKFDDIYDEFEKLQKEIKNVNN